MLLKILLTGFYAGLIGSPTRVSINIEVHVGNILLGICFSLSPNVIKNIW